MGKKFERKRSEIDSRKGRLRKVGKIVEKCRVEVVFGD